MRGKRILSILMAVTLLGGTVAQAVEARTEGARTVLKAPKVTVVGNHVTDTAKKGDYELSLYVQGDHFQTVGVVLSYDREKLIPVSWESDEAIAADQGWTKIMPTKGLDELAGKPALLCAKAETPVPDPDEPGAEAETDESGSETPVIPVTPERDYLYLGAEALQGEDYSESETRVVTVRFRLAAEGTEIHLPAAGQEESENFDICLATDADILNLSIPGMALRSTVLDGMGLPVVYTYKQNLTTEEGADADNYTVAFDTRNGESVNTGASETVSGDYAITFFDWDGRVIDAIASPEDGTKAVELWQGGQLVQDRLKNKAGYEFNEWLVVYQPNDGRDLQTINGSLTSVKASESTPADAEAAPKPEAKLYAQDTFSGNGGDLEKINTAALAAKVNVAGGANNASAGSKTSVLLQASYKTTDDVNSGWHDMVGNRIPAPTNPGEKDVSGENADISWGDTRYIISNPTFYQYGLADENNGQYAIRCNVSRNNVIRADQPTVRVIVYLDSGEFVTVKVDLENTDETSFEVVVPKAATRVSYVLLDTYGNVAWTTSDTRSKSDIAEHADIMREGARALMADEAFRGAWKYAEVQCFKDAGFSKVTDLSSLNNARAALIAATGSTPLDSAGVESALSAYK